MTSHPQRQGPTRYRCSVCPGGHSMRTLYPHASSAAHLAAVQDFLKEQDAERALRNQSDNARPANDPPRLDNLANQLHFTHDILDHDSDPPSPPPSPLTLLRGLDLNQPDPFDLGLGDDAADSDTSEGGLDFDRMRLAIEALENELDDDDARLDEEALEEDIAGVRVQDAAEWHPVVDDRFNTELTLTDTIPPNSIDTANRWGVPAGMGNPEGGGQTIEGQSRATPSRTDQPLREPTIWVGY
ncbi:uncharacterized protein MELLADRAFT_88121 [Melampsora larici-populina 98AG31]|uniref:Uncharacterized protein n=1 Tax=Melampsora larici-populina (strain 98AG31 / pathotype 3-4-7) TaxID=747676 RepID=F4SE42_MELLP|nr:uncharacterized protein MELLADRAFT_88121 [Melampsora larici-populina 98AG31]EGF97082.1 hypothetical protein MELLADRAFT_88121 [Melampsora larici-populina 98AG31]